MGDPPVYGPAKAAPPEAVTVEPTALTVANEKLIAEKGAV